MRLRQGVTGGRHAVLPSPLCGRGENKKHAVHVRGSAGGKRGPSFGGAGRTSARQHFTAPSRLTLTSAAPMSNIWTIVDPGQDHLPRDGAVQVQLPRLVHNAHAAAPDLVQNLVAAHPRRDGVNRLTGSKRHDAARFPLVGIHHRWHEAGERRERRIGRIGPTGVNERDSRRVVVNWGGNVEGRVLPAGASPLVASPYTGCSSASVTTSRMVSPHTGQAIAADPFGGLHMWPNEQRKPPAIPEPRKSGTLQLSPRPMQAPERNWFG